LIGLLHAGKIQLDSSPKEQPDWIHASGIFSVSERKNMQFVSVLLVDDNPDFLKLTAEFLRRYDDIHIVGCASGGKRGGSTGAGA
jgi:hypothetical protein